MEPREILFEYGFESVNGIVKKQYYLHEIPNIAKKCDVWDMLPLAYVRQYTGLKDKNGKKIFEYDKSIHDGKIVQVEWNKSQFRWSVYDVSKDDIICHLNETEFEIIHDNPELLEK